jgi:hypothetical protein
MRNRAKCKLCKDIIESKYVHDYVNCRCGEISVDGGNEYHRCRAISWENFMRIDDEGNEIIVKVVDKESIKPNNIEMEKKPDKKELLAMLDRMIQNIDELPKEAMQTYINHYDFYSILLLLASIFKEENKNN